jgi:hypothetical protein
MGRGGAELICSLEFTIFCVRSESALHFSQVGINPEDFLLVTCKAVPLHASIPRRFRTQKPLPRPHHLSAILTR